MIECDSIETRTNTLWVVFQRDKARQRWPDLGRHSWFMCLWFFFYLNDWEESMFFLDLHHRRFTNGDTLLGEAGGNVLLYKSCGRAKAVWSRSGDGQIKISSDWSLAFVLPALKDSLGFERRLSSIFPLLVMCRLRHLALIVNPDQWHVLSLPSCLSHFSPGNMAVL